MKNTDLFETPELLPTEIKAILDKYSKIEMDYPDLANMALEMEAKGYTFEYGLCGTPFNLREMENTITYHRQPTKAEIKFGHGAKHYKDFPLSQCTKPDGNYKKWLICTIDGLRYYY